MQVLAAGILLSDKKVLLGRRLGNLKFYPGVWDIVGGHVEDGETTEQTLLRELREELGVTPTHFTPITVLHFSDASTSEDYECHIYLVTDWSGTPQNMAHDEHSEVSWFGIAHARRFALPIYQEIFKGLDDTPAGTEPD